MLKASRLFLSSLWVLLLFTLLFSTVYAGSTSDKIKEIENKKKETQSNAKTAADRISELESSKSSLESYLGNLNTQLMQISDNLFELETRLLEKEEEIQTTKEDLEAIRAEEISQYDSMKKRIQFMYEKGNTAYIEILLSSESISDLLNKAEYITKIAEYDRSMLIKYQNIKESIVETEARLELEQDELKVLQDEIVIQQDSVAAMINSTATEIVQFSDKIGAAEELAAEYEAELLSQENTLENLKKIEAEEKAAAEKAAKEKAAKEKAAAEKKQQDSLGQEGTTPPADSTTPPADSTPPPSTPSDGGEEEPSSPNSAGDLALLAAIIQCEADGESYEGKLAVGSVVMNRVRSSRYPSTLLGVLYQSFQFAPVTSGRFAIVLAKGANSECVRAAQEVLNVGSTIGDFLHFRTIIPGLEGVIIGNHIFY